MILEGVSRSMGRLVTVMPIASTVIVQLISFAVLHHVIHHAILVQLVVVSIVAVERLALEMFVS